MGLETIVRLPGSLEHLVEKARALGPVRVAVAGAAQGLVIETLREAHDLGLIEPQLVGLPKAIRDVAEEVHWRVAEKWIVPVASDAAAAATAVAMVRGGEADIVMKGHLHTDELMHALHRHCGRRLKLRESIGGPHLERPRRRDPGHPLSGCTLGDVRGPTTVTR